jgi:hypothetical protein
VIVFPAVTDRWGQYLKPGVKVQHHAPKRAPAWFGEVVTFNHGWVRVKRYDNGRMCTTKPTHIEVAA